MNKQLLIIILSGFLLSCAETRSNITTDKITVNDKRASIEKVKYTCNRNTQLLVNFASTVNDGENDIAIINGFSEQAIILPNKAVASGFLYSNGKYVLRGKGEQATWTVGRMAPFQCSVGDKLLPQEQLK